MNARWLAIGSSAVIVLCLVGSASGPGRCTRRQGDRRGDRAGVAFLKEAQSDEGHWDEPVAARAPARHDGAGGAGAPGERRRRATRRRFPGRARSSSSWPQSRIKLTTSRWRSLFLARCQQASRGEADALIQTLGRRLAGGDQEGIWTYTVPRKGQETEDTPSRSRRGERRKAARRNLFFGGQGDNSNTQFALLGLWAAGRHGLDSDRAAGIDRSPFPLVTV